MANGRHSYVRFFPSDWIAGTARMTRTHRSIYFDICCFVWDQNRPCPPSEIRLMLGDVHDWEGHLQDLIDGGKVIRLDDGSITNGRAAAEAQQAFDLWERKSAGGRAGAAKTNSGKSGDGTPGDTLDETGAALPPQNQNHNQNQIKPNGLSHRDLPAELVEVWNGMAPQADLSKVEKLTESRRKHLKARIAEHGFDRLAEAFRRIPESRFLTGGGDRGWKATIDSMIRPDNAAKLIEGAYHGSTGKQSGWLGVIRGDQ